MGPPRRLGDGQAVYLVDGRMRAGRRKPNEKASHSLDCGSRVQEMGDSSIALFNRDVLLRETCYSAICAWTAVMATTPTMSSAEQPRDRSFTGLAMPCRMGP